MIVSMDKVEGEIANGGLPQLLWNVFFHWRHVLTDCEAGYEIIGAIPQRNAVREFRALFERHERDCRGYIDRCVSERDFSYFNKWCDHASAFLKSENERLFYPDSGIEEVRCAWMRRNEATLLQLVSNP